MIYVLAGVNGGGKSSIGGQVLREQGINWFNPDDWSRDLQGHGWDRERADIAAWQEGQRRLHQALDHGRCFVFETTLGGSSVSRTLARATATHDVLIWYVGLDSVELHLERVRLRVAHGGHSIPEAKVRQRFLSSVANLARLVPLVHGAQIYDNSRSVSPGERLRPPQLLAEIAEGRLVWPPVEGFRALPAWVRPVIGAVLDT